MLDDWIEVENTRPVPLANSKGRGVKSNFENELTAEIVPKLDEDTDVNDDDVDDLNFCLSFKIRSAKFSWSARFNDGKTSGNLSVRLEKTDAIGVFVKRSEPVSETKTLKNCLEWLNEEKLLDRFASFSSFITAFLKSDLSIAQFWGQNFEDVFYLNLPDRVLDSVSIVGEGVFLV